MISYSTKYLLLLATILYSVYLFCSTLIMFLSKNQFSSFCKLLPSIYLRVSKNYYFSISQRLLPKQKLTFPLTLRDIPKQLFPRPLALRGLHLGHFTPVILPVSILGARPLPQTIVPHRNLVTYSKLGKFKPNKAVVSRFRLTSTGKVKKWRCRTPNNLKRRGRILMKECWRAQKIRIMLGKSRYNIRRHPCWVD